MKPESGIEQARGPSHPRNAGAGNTRNTPSRIALLEDSALLLAYLRDHLGKQVLEDPLAERSPRARVAAVLAPMYSLDGRPHLLFTQRTTTLSAHSGEISFPGGSRDPADVSLIQTALRESHEELGLDPARVTVLGQLPRVFTNVSNFIVTPYVGWLGDGLPELRPNGAEVAEVIYAPLAALAEPAIFHEEHWLRGGIAHTVYFYDLVPYRIWGLTGRIVHHLLALLPPD